MTVVQPVYEKQRLRSINGKVWIMNHDVFIDNIFVFRCAYDKARNFLMYTQHLCKISTCCA